MSRDQVLVCFGTRPEVIKLAPVVERLRRHPSLEPLVVTTAQHRQMLDQTMSTFGLVPDVDLSLMRPGQSLDSLASAAIATLGDVIRRSAPRAVVVQGDTTTALCAALAAYYAQVPVAHVEAGLRTGDRTSPFPEEANRRMIASLADWHFCPTEHAAGNLRAEGVAPADVYVTGNTVIDALHHVLAHGEALAAAAELPSRTRARRIVVTVHRRESQGDAQRRLMRVLARVIERDDVEVVLPVHLNPAVRRVVLEELDGRPGVHLLDPLGYASFIALVRTSDIVLTDSGGLQEEAPALGVPLLVMRDTTERPEGVRAGCVELCGTQPERVEAALGRLLDDPGHAASMSAAPHPYGDGRAAIRIVETLARDLAAVRPAESTEPAGDHASSRVLLPTGAAR